MKDAQLSANTQHLLNTVQIIVTVEKSEKTTFKLEVVHLTPTNPFQKATPLCQGLPETSPIPHHLLAITRGPQTAL